MWFCSYELGHQKVDVTDFGWLDCTWSQALSLLVNELKNDDHLDSGLAEVDPLGEILAHESVRIVRALEDLFQSRQLGAGECRSIAPRFFAAATTAAVAAAAAATAATTVVTVAVNVAAVVVDDDVVVVAGGGFVVVVRMNTMWGNRGCRLLGPSRLLVAGTIDRFVWIPFIWVYQTIQVRCPVSVQVRLEVN